MPAVGKPAQGNTHDAVEQSEGKGSQRAQLRIGQLEVCFQQWEENVDNLAVGKVQDINTK
jgi:hypothetical protein